jgi:SAM-dependent methyltransferase
MRWFRSRGKSDAAPRAGVPGGPSERFDWRSYDAIAEDYERVLAPHTARVAADLVALADLRPGERVLDLGTGTGRGVEAAGAAAIGLDSAPHMLMVGRRRRADIALAAGEVINLPFREATFDVVIANFSLAYFEKLDTALFDVMRVLAPGGRLAASAWTDEEDELSAAWRRIAEDTVGVDVLRQGIKDEAPWEETLADRARLEGVLRDAGLRPVRVERRDYRFTMPREDYLVGHEIEATGRFVRRMLGPELWGSFRARTRQVFAERFPEQIGDFRYALLAVGTKPAP